MLQVYALKIFRFHFLGSLCSLLMISWAVQKFQFDVGFVSIGYNVGLLLTLKPRRSHPLFPSRCFRVSEILLFQPVTYFEFILCLNICS